MTVIELETPDLSLLHDDRERPKGVHVSAL